MWRCWDIWREKGYITGKGYIVSPTSYVVVVGGVNMDIGGISHAQLVSADSNPGRVRISLGGVGRNIAHNMALMGLDVRMVTVLGGDFYAQKIVSTCGEMGIDISRSLRVADAITSTYLFISGPDGDMKLAISDMDIYSHLTPAFLASKLSLFNNAKLLVVDTNIPAESIAWLVEHVEVPVFADPVSTAKAEKLRPVLGKLHTIKPNRIEAELLSGVSITDERSLRRAANVLLKTGLQQVFISLGAGGVFAANQDRGLHLPSIPGPMVNATGCGDAFMAALAWAYMEGMDLEQSAYAGLAASSIALEGSETINPEMSVDAIKSRLA